MQLITAFTAVALCLSSWVAAYTNPVIFEDLADVDLRRYNDTYYLSTSTFHFSPGAPILRSYDLVNWEFIGHSVPSLANYFGNQYTLPAGSNGYNGGIWASWLIFVPSQDRWFWGGCVNFWQTHVFSSTNSDPTSAWSQIATVDGCQYDSGAMLDDDGSVYVSFKNLTDSTIHIAQMSADMKTVAKQSLVFALPSSDTSMEGTRPYKVNDVYYIFTSDPVRENVLKSNGDIWGTYALNKFLSGETYPAPLSGTIGQGALVDTPAGDWYWMSFSWSYPGGRIPVLIPVTWDSNGLPVPTLVNGNVGASYPDPVTPRPTTNNLTGVDRFTGTSLGPQWEWNHDPDTAHFTVNNGLTLSTATVTNDWFAARNTLTHRQLGPISTATIQLSYSSLADGDRAGLGLFRDQSAYIGVWRAGSTFTVNMVNSIVMSNSNFTTLSTGTTAASASVSGGTIWLRVISDSTPGGDSATFWYSTDGTKFSQLGPAFKCDTDYQYFEGQRFAIFNFATKALGGSVRVADFELAAGSYTGVAVGAGSSAPATSSLASTQTSKASTPTTTSAASTGGGSGWYGS
ncbi:glycoside hydrolase family 43 protein [Peniophora sp. CONT]|nr:glycoside hydrolase family 43 protein [Peniophora sp. CONT]